MNIYVCVYIYVCVCVCLTPQTRIKRLPAPNTRDNQTILHFKQGVSDWQSWYQGSVAGINESSYDHLKMFIWMLVTYLVSNYNFLSQFSLCLRHAYDKNNLKMIARSCGNIIPEAEHSEDLLGSLHIRFKCGACYSKLVRNLFSTLSQSVLL